MGHPGFNNQWFRDPDDQRHQHSDRRRGPGGHGGRGGPGGTGSWADGPMGWGRPGRQGPPPWVAGLFGLAQGEQRRGPRVRRGDVRAAILDVLRASAESGEPTNGYQVIQQIAERSNDAWKPSPGSVYPTIQQLQDEGLVETDDERGRRTLRLTAEGTTYIAEHPEELAAVWAPFEARDRDRTSSDAVDLKPEIGQVMSAVWQIVTSGSEQQRKAAVDVLVDTRRSLYGILADGHENETDTETDEVDGTPGEVGRE